MLKNIKVSDLKKIPIFRECTEDELRYLSRDLEERECRKGDLVYKEREVPGLLYIVQKGSVEITKSTTGGHNQTIAVLQAGQFFGELSFFGKRRHAARAVALTDTRLVLLSRFIYDELEQEQPLLVHKLLREIILVISANLDSMNDMFLQMIHYTFYSGKAGKVDLRGKKTDRR